MLGLASQATLTSSATAADRVTVNVALEPSATAPLGPLMLRSAWLVLTIVTVAGETLSPWTDPFTRTVSSPSTTASLVGVKVKSATPYDWSVEMVTVPVAAE